jgi:hypothetical protein
MTTLTADEAMLAVLRQAQGPAEIRDAQGAVVGFYTPVSAGQVPGERGRTTRELFEHLKSLTTDPAMQAYLQTKIDGLKERDQCATP